MDLKKYLNPKYVLKIGDIYLAYLLFAEDIVLFSEFAENVRPKIELFYMHCALSNLSLFVSKEYR